MASDGEARAKGEDHADHNSAKVVTETITATCHAFPYYLLRPQRKSCNNPSTSNSISKL